MAQPLCSLGPRTDQESFLPATLESAGRCPARADYVELWFATPQGRWTWCFPDPGGDERRAPRPLAVTVGRYGAQAHLLTDDGPGPALPSSEALPMILAGAEVRIARRLVTAHR
jgi:hypothetical protein